MVKQSLLLVVLVCWMCKTNAQHTFTTNSTPLLIKQQDTLAKLSEEIFSASDDAVRLEKNAQFVRKFVNSLKTNGSIAFGFDSLKRISILKAPDQSFRIITWFVPLNDGTYRYYGTIQLATPNGSLKLIPLTDGSSSISEQQSFLNSKNWLGARYYEMIPIVVNGKQPYYILLGWKGNDSKTSKKVIEVLTIDKNEAIFGKEIFETEKNKALKNRVIFEYSKQNTMTLIWDKKTNLIVFDHLAPYDPKMVGKFEYYGSDLSFDAYKVAWGKLSLLENVPMKNDPSANDEFYKSPKKASQVLNPTH